MGHINLVSPVTNIIFFKTMASSLSKLLEISAEALEDIIYFRVYVVIDNGSTNLLKKKDILNLEKRKEQYLISEILREVIQNKKLSEDIIEEAKKLDQDLIKKDDSEANSVFLEDYLIFLEKHLQVKI
jgi:DNA-directed RNA polymerase beta' subunit